MAMKEYCFVRMDNNEKATDWVKQSSMEEFHKNLHRAIKQLGSSKLNLRIREELGHAEGRSLS